MFIFNPKLKKQVESILAAEHGNDSFNYILGELNRQQELQLIAGLFAEDIDIRGI
jgi:hypothetical protein